MDNIPRDEASVRPEEDGHHGDLLSASEELYREFIARLESGEQVDMEEYYHKYPQLERTLRQFFVPRLAGTPGSSDTPIPGTPTGQHREPPNIIGDFRIIQEIGKGSMGRVYEAEQISLNRNVALKILPSHLSFSTDAVLKFRREASAAGRLNHPGIVAVHAVGEEDGIHFIAQELVEGGCSLADNLKGLRKKQDQFQGYYREAAQILAEVAEALQEAHDAGVIHRDIKPSNILISKTGSPKVSDFGLARVEDSLHLSRTGELAGTPYYMSPEQASSPRIPVDSRTDIYSLGVTFYEMLTFRRPFEGHSSQEVLKKIIFQEPRDPRRLNPRVPPDLAVICLKAMEKKADSRYPTMKELAADLLRFISGDVIHATPAGPVLKAWKVIKRNPAVSAALAAAFIALHMLFIYILWSYPKIYDERNKALAAVAFAKEAEASALKERDEKEAALVRSDGLRLAARSYLVSPPNPALSLIIAIEAAQRNSGLTTNNALLEAIKNCHEESTLYHGNTVLSVKFSPDGSKVVTAAKDGTAMIWDGSTGEPLAELSGHKAEIRSVCFSPDGGKVITASDDQTVRIWDAPTGKILTLLVGHEGKIRSACFSPDGSKVVTAGEDLTVRIWDGSTGSELSTFRGHEDRIYRAVFSPDGEWVATASQDRTARIFQVSSGKELVRLEGHVGGVSSVLFSPDGTRLLTCSEDYTARIWDTERGEAIHILRRHGGTVNTAVFSPDGERVLTSSNDNTAMIWDAVDGEVIVTLRGHTANVTDARFSTDGQRVVTAAYDATARIWDAATGELLNTLLGHEGGLTTARFSPDSRQVVTGCEDYTARIWNVEGDTESFTVKGNTGTYRTAEFSNDGTRVVAATHRNGVAILDAANGEMLLTLRGHEDMVNAARFSPDGKKVASASEDHTARIWDARSGERLVVLKGHGDDVNNASFSPDGLSVVTASDDQTARIWDAATGKEILSILGHGNVINYAVFSPDGRRVATASGDNTARIWNASTGKELVALEGHTEDINMVRFSADGLKVVTASDDRTTRIWHARTGKKFLTLKGHEGAVTAAAFSPDGGKVVTSAGKRLWKQLVYLPSVDKTARIWDAETGAEIVTLSGHRGEVFTATFCPEGRRVATASADGRIKFWPVDPLAAAHEKKPRELTLGEKEKYHIWNQGEKEAKGLVDDFFDLHILSSDVITILEARRDLEPSVKELALEFARARKDDPNRLNNTSWAIVKSPGESLDAYEVALRAAEAACGVDPENGYFLNTLALAHYRLGHYEEALPLFYQSDRHNQKKWGPASPYNVAFITLSHHHLGNHDEALASLSKLRTLAKDSRWCRDEECEAFIREVERMMPEKN